MTVAFDASSSVDLQSVPSPITWTHTPVGTPRGILVFIYHTNLVDEVTGATYGGVTMTEVSGSPNLHLTAELGSVHAFFLGASVPTGAQTVSVHRVTSPNDAKSAVALSYTAADNIQIDDADVSINSDSAANPSGTLNTSVGGNCALIVGFFSGQQTVGGITPLSGWTSRLETDFGSQCGGVYTKDTNTTGGDQTYGWTQTAEDAVAIGVAITEVTTTGLIAQERNIMRRVAGRVFSRVN